MVECVIFFLLMIRRTPRSTRTDTLFPYTTRFRSGFEYAIGFGRGAAERDHHDDVAKAHRFAHPFEGAALERKPFAIAVVIIARRAPESEHRILFLRFEDVAAYEVGVFVGLEVAEANDGGVRVIRSEEHPSEL